VTQGGKTEQADVKVDIELSTTMTSQ